MDDMAEWVSFQVVPGPKGLAEAEQRLRSAGFEQIKPSPDGRRLLVVAPRHLVERVLGFPLVERQRQGSVGAAKRVVVNLELPKGAVLPLTLQDAVAEIVFPVTPDYYSSSTLKQKSLR